MFDDQNNSVGAPPSNLPLQPDDMLAGVDDSQASSPSSGGTAAPPDALSAGLLKPKVTTMPPLPPTQGAALTYSTKPPVLGKVLGVVIGVLVLGGIVFLGVWIYTHFFAVKSQPASSTIPSTPATPEVPVTPSVTPSSTLPSSPATSTPPVVTGDTTDSDHDGLTDEEERFYGTDTHKTDTDGDGLTDFEEVKVWGTDPLTPDTDGDGYKDGDEVKNGYNPKGPGKLFNIPTSTTASSPTLPPVTSTTSTRTPTSSTPVSPSTTTPHPTSTPSAPTRL